MKMRKVVAVLCAILPCVLIPYARAGGVLQYVGSENPLADPSQSKADEKLIGTWEGKNKFVTVRLAIDRFPLAGIEEGRVKLPPGHMLAKVAKGDTELGEVAFFVTTIGNETFFHLYDPPQKAGKRGYLVGKYSVKGDKLELFWGRNSREVIEKKLLKGVLRESRILESSIIDGYLTDTTENMVKFIGNGGSKHLFSRDDTHWPVLTKVTKRNRRSKLEPLHCAARLTRRPARAMTSEGSCEGGQAADYWALAA